ncbi:MAG: alpha-L-fucosidase, partial [Puniceicoccales bacterium]|nr:alpha-L-fucosidase [Puniceicoccales bacterium]
MAFLFAAAATAISAQENKAQDASSHATAIARERAREIRLPTTDHHYKRTSNYIEESPEETYFHAPEAAHEAFKDIKFGVRIHWGIYSIWEMNGESWGFIRNL